MLQCLWDDGVRLTFLERLAQHIDSSGIAGVAMAYIVIQAMRVHQSLVVSHSPQGGKKMLRVNLCFAYVSHW